MLKVISITKLNIFSRIICPVCGSSSATEDTNTKFTSINNSAVFCDECNAKFEVRHTAGDPGYVVDCSIETVCGEKYIKIAKEKMPNGCCLVDKEGEYYSGWMRKGMGLKDSYLQEIICRNIITQDLLFNTDLLVPGTIVLAELRVGHKLYEDGLFTIRECDKQKLLLTNGITYPTITPMEVDRCTWELRVIRNKE